MAQKILKSTASINNTTNEDQEEEERLIRTSKSEPTTPADNVPMPSLAPPGDEIFSMDSSTVPKQTERKFV